jgi:hypothetical protein
MPPAATFHMGPDGRLPEEQAEERRAFWAQHVEPSNWAAERHHYGVIYTGEVGRDRD